MCNVECGLEKMARLLAFEAEILALKASLSAMNADNEARARLNQAQAWPGSCFGEVQDELNIIAERLRDEI